ncbi:MAG: dTDP-4-amino-4,6-dideoxygalactose transaminase [Clostridia bacterium]|jgi:dTDP-4-amino-4,6-dideoxy-D-glucose transaminase
MIGFNIPIYMDESINCIKKAAENRKICGDGEFTKKCSKLMEEKFNAQKILLTTSCTSALEMAAILLDIQPGDEVILPSYTFVSTADAFVMVGAKIVFVDINPKTMNIDENKIEEAITSKTKAIVVVHYAGISPDMDRIMKIAKEHNLKVVEDSAQGVMAKYKDKYLGTIADLGCYSFHETKNYSMGEGGAIVINDPELIERAEIIREKGTNRNKFFRGEIDKYTWVDYGSSYLPSELNCAYLYPQLKDAEMINNDRLTSWNYYKDGLKELEKDGCITLQYVPEYSEHNAHMFYIKAKNLEERTMLIEYLKSKGIQAVFHYIPLHTSPAGMRFGRFFGEDKYTTSESEKLVRLPMYYGLTRKEQDEVINAIKEFYKN